MQPADSRVKQDPSVAGGATPSGSEGGASKSATRVFTLRDRVILTLVSWIGALAIRLIGLTMRLTESTDVPSEPMIRTRPVVYCFWHRCIFQTCYAYRGVGMTTMISRSFDGEYIARIAHRFGHKTVRGSSSRGALSGFRGLLRELEDGRSVVIPVDGPRGPRYVAQPGPVLLAQNAQCEILCFYVAVDRAWVLNSWDRMLIPKPFARAHTHLGRPIVVPSNAGEEERARFVLAVQAELERVRRVAESNIGIEPGSRLA